MEIDKIPNVSERSVFYRGERDTTLPGMTIASGNVTEEPKHPIFIWHKENHDDSYAKILLGRPENSDFPPVDIVLRAPIDSHDTKYFEISERGIINQGTLSGKHYIICKNIQYDDLGKSGYINTLNGGYTGYMWRYDHKLYGFNNTLVLVGNKQFPFEGEIVDGTNAVDENEKSIPDKPIMVASMVDNYTTPIVRLEFSITDETDYKFASLQFKVGILDITQPYELDEPGDAAENMVRGMSPQEYAVSKIYTQEGFINDPADTDDIIVSDPNFIIWNGGFYGTENKESWNTLEILYRFPQVWIWWNNLLITPLGNPLSIDPNARVVNTQYFPMDIDFLIGKTGLRLWPGAKIRSIEIRDKLKYINEYARM
jgi:hypothetical protein